MQNERFAGIDIGSNAGRLIIKNVVPGKTYKDAILNKLVYLRLPFRLGGDAFTVGRLTAEKIHTFVKGMKIYKNLLEYYQIPTSHYRACATSAMRSSKNGDEVIKLVKQETGIQIELIDGQEEAELIFRTNIYNLPDGDIFLSADLGGGSLQLSLFDKKNLIWTHSYKIGTIRMLNQTVDNSEFDKLFDKLEKIAKDYKNIRVIGSGGNINKISKIVGEKNMEIDDIKKLYDKLAGMTLDERIKKYKFRRDRADVIVPAARIYIDLLEKLDVKKIYVPKTGLADGIIRQLYEKHIDNK